VGLEPTTSWQWTHTLSLNFLWHCMMNGGPWSIECQDEGKRRPTGIIIGKTVVSRNPGGNSLGSPPPDRVCTIPIDPWPRLDLLDLLVRAVRHAHLRAHTHSCWEQRAPPAHTVEKLVCQINRPFPKKSGRGVPGSCSVPGGSGRIAAPRTFAPWLRAGGGEGKKGTSGDEVMR